jgi:hypothetical protein
LLLLVLLSSLLLLLLLAIATIAATIAAVARCRCCALSLSRVWNFAHICYFCYIFDCNMPGPNVAEQKRKSKERQTFEAVYTCIYCAGLLRTSAEATFLHVSTMEKLGSYMLAASVWTFTGITGTAQRDQNRQCLS